MLALVLVAISVGLGNFGAAAAMGIAGVERRHVLRIVTTFAAFEAAMPVLGILLGRSVVASAGSVPRIVAGLVLCAVGVYEVVRELRGRATAVAATTRLGHLLVLAAVLSIDNFAVGFALGADHVSLVAAFAVLGLVSALLTLAGLELGSRLGRRMGEWSELLGGALLVAIGGAIAAGL